MDSQIVEILGRSRLTEELLRAGLEVASPVRDRGIDLLAYLDSGPDVRSFCACPIQMKASSNTGFGLDAKYARFPNLVIAYVWHVDSSAAEITFAMSYGEALGIADAMGWTQTSSWLVGKKYSNSGPGAKLRDLMEPFRMDSAAWRNRVLGFVAPVA
jgi:hypothetical protein